MSENILNIDKFYHQQSIVSINTLKIFEVANLFLSSCTEEFITKTGPIVTPFLFDTFPHEVNFLSLLHLLGVGSKFEHRSKEASQENLSDVILYGVIGAFLSNTDLHAQFMKSSNTSDCGRLFSLPMMQTEESKSSLFTVETKGALYDYANMLSETMIITGKQLLEQGYADLYSLLIDCLRITLQESQDSLTTIDLLVKKIADKLTWLDDRHFVSVREVNSGQEEISELHFFKNIRRLLYFLHLRIIEKNEDNSISANSALSLWKHVIPSEPFDNMLASPSCRGINALFQLGILTPKSVSSDTHEISFDKIEEGGIETEVSIRATATMACHMLCDAINAKLLNTIDAQKTLQRDEITPFKISLYLDYILEADSCRNVVCSNFVYIPHSGSDRW
jgi:hypothetical protein